VHNLFLVYFVNIIYDLYVFWTSPGPSSGGTTVFMRYLVLVILYTRQNNKYQVSHKYSCSSWWWTWRSPKHVEVINNIDELYWEYCAPSWFHLQDYIQRCTINRIKKNPPWYNLHVQNTTAPVIWQFPVHIWHLSEMNTAKKMQCVAECMLAKYEFLQLDTLI